MYNHHHQKYLAELSTYNPLHVVVVVVVCRLSTGLPLKVTLDHSRQGRRAKRSCGKESSEETPRKWACLDLCNFFHFCFAWVRWNTIGQKAGKARKLSIYYVWWGAIRSPWSRYVPHVLTMKNKSGCAYYCCFNKLAVIKDYESAFDAV